MRHVVIVGGGIIGASCAYQVQAAGAQVTLVDAGAPSATAASFGWINDSFFLDADHYRFRAAGLEAYRRLGAQLDVAIEWCGSLSWEDAPDARDERFAALRDLGCDVRRITRAEFQALEPEVAAPPQEALLFPKEGIVHPGHVAATLLAAAESLGAQIVRGVAVTGLVERGDGCGGVQTALGPILAEETLICAGVHSAGLVSALDVALPMKSSPALVVRTPPQPRLARHVLSSAFGDVRQMASGEIVTPAATNHQASTTNGAPEAPQEVATRTSARLQQLFGRPLEWAEVALAHRPVPEDDRPVIGQACGGLYVAVMHSGVTLAGIVGELVARELCEGPSNRSQDLLSAYRPQRFEAG